jgi:hypothetical protein
MILLDNRVCVQRVQAISIYMCAKNTPHYVGYMNTVGGGCARGKTFCAAHIVERMNRVKLPKTLKTGVQAATDIPIFDLFRVMCYPPIMDITINTHDLEQHGLALHQMPSIISRAQRAMVNNMAFGVRETCLTWGIPQAMTVRNPNILRATLRVTKATYPGFTASMGMTTKDRFGGLLEEELGGTIKRQPATLAARGGDEKKQIKGVARFRGDFISPEDIDVANDTGGWEQRIVVMISQLERQNYSKPFILHGSTRYSSGLKVLGKRLGTGTRKTMRHRKRASNNVAIPVLRRALTTLRTFTKGQTQVKRTPWMRPSIDRWLASHDRQTEWNKALAFAMSKLKQGV